MITVLKKQWHVLAVATLLAGCGTTNTTVQRAVPESGEKASIGFFKNFDEAAFAVVESVGQSWRLVRLSAKRPLRENERQEIISTDGSELVSNRRTPKLIRSSIRKGSSFGSTAAKLSPPCLERSKRFRSTADAAKAPSRR